MRSRSVNEIIIEQCNRYRNCGGNGDNNCNSDKTFLKDLRQLIASVKSLKYNDIVFNSRNIFLNDREEALLQDMIERYQKNEPVSKILNSRCFWNHEFFVNLDVLDPRPETELIIEMILSKFDDTDACLNFLDIGTGSGCILLSLLSEYKNAHGVGIDISSCAIDVAKYNQKKLNISSANFKICDWNDFNREYDHDYDHDRDNCNNAEIFDIIVCNPPYIKTDDISRLEENVRNYDPLLALDGGVTGTKAYNEIAILAKRCLKSEGYIFLEIGYGQTEEVCQILQSNNFKICDIKKDLNGIDRVISAFFKPSHDALFQELSN